MTTKATAPALNVDRLKMMSAQLDESVLAIDESLLALETALQRVEHAVPDSRQMQRARRALQKVRDERTYLAATADELSEALGVQGDIEEPEAWLT